MRTMFDQGFRPAAVTLGQGQANVMGNSFTDIFKKYTSLVYPQAATTPVPPGTVPLVAPKAPEPLILGFPQSTVMWTGAAVLGLGVVGAILYSQKG